MTVPVTTANASNTHRGPLLAIILASYLMIVLDISIVITALPKIQAGILSPLTASGIAGVAAEDAGAASGLVNVSHQLGGSLGLGVLAVVITFILRRPEAHVFSLQGR